YLEAGIAKRGPLADSELKKTVQSLRKAGKHEAEMADMLEHPPAPAKALDLSLRVSDKALFLTAMTVRDPVHRRSYLPLARKLNSFDTRFPYWTLRKILDTPKPK